MVFSEVICQSTECVTKELRSEMSLRSQNPQILALFLVRFLT